MQNLRVAGAQLDLVVGDLPGNEEKILSAMAKAEEQHADVLVLPELAITGYPPEDLLLRQGFIDANLEVLHRLASASRRTVTLLGFVDRVVVGRIATSDAIERTLANAAGLLYDGAVRGVYHKVLLPDYGVFDETRYFIRGGNGAALWGLDGVAAGVSVCEDIWVAAGPPAHQAAGGAQVLLNINASPFHYGKATEREAMLRQRTLEAGVPLVYVNQVGGQDELVFDGASLVLAADGTVLYRAPQFVEHFFVVDVPISERRSSRVIDSISSGRAERRPLEPLAPVPLLDPPEAEVYGALVVGLRDYVRKNGFHHVVIGLSGGIDSALTAALAADALGPEQVLGISMPSRFSSEGSVTDSRDLAERLGIRFEVVPMDDVFEAYLQTLKPVFAGEPFGVAEENLQARIRGAILMAVSNKFGGMVVATGNKSEMAVGYATLYGDMAGGYAVLKDVLKTLVYRLAAWRNTEREVIPPSIIEKPPSAELRPGQLDSDSLPDYDELDGILRGYVEDDLSVAGVVARGFAPDVVARVARLVDQNEYKRRQAAPGVKITTKAFGKDRRLPITNGYQGR
ncbi:MAG: NAD+ synthase [Acidimicrobiia bacterium]|nr:NAD+ synthase [Acidimicrobiia bacterium]